MKKLKQILLNFLTITFGCFLFALGFDLFLEPCGLNAGGLTGIAVLIHHLTGFATVGTIALVINIPLFVIAGIRIGKRFFLGSLCGTVMCAVAIDILTLLPKLSLEPLIGGLYGGMICGAGQGIIFAAGFSTGGSDIIARFAKYKRPNMQIGVITILFDLGVAVMTGIVFRDLTKMLYCGVAIMVTGWIIDAVVYRFDYSKVAIIISTEHDAVTEAIAKKLNRGATLLHGEGSYTHEQKEVILTAIKRHQLADLKKIVTEIDPEAFIIVQEAHQVLGDGFLRYSKDSL